MKKNIETHVDFADGEMHSLALTNKNNLIIHIKSWREDIIEIVFSNVLWFLFSRSDVLEGLYVIDNSPLVEAALAENYVNIPNRHSFKLFQFEDIQDHPFIQVVAEGAKVSQEGDLAQ